MLAYCDPVPQLNGPCLRLTAAQLKELGLISGAYVWVAVEGTKRAAARVLGGHASCTMSLDLMASLGLEKEDVVQIDIVPYSSSLPLVAHLELRQHTSVTWPIRPWIPVGAVLVPGMVLGDYCINTIRCDGQETKDECVGCMAPTTRVVLKRRSKTDPWSESVLFVRVDPPRGAATFPRLYRPSVGAMECAVEAFCTQSDRPVLAQFESLALGPGMQSVLTRILEQNKIHCYADSVETIPDSIMALFDRVELPTKAAAVQTKQAEHSLSQFGGIDDVLDQIETHFMAPLQERDRYRDAGFYPSKGLLLVGPGGSGKTSLAAAVGNSAVQRGLIRHFEMVYSTDIVSKAVGESEMRLRHVFQRCRERSPAMIFFDELETIASTRTEEDHAMDRLLSMLLVELDGMTSTDDDIMVLATTRNPLWIDPAILRPGRLDLHITLPEWDVHRRKAILDIVCPGHHTALMAETTEGFSPADLHNMWREAAMNALRRNLALDVDDVNQDDIDAAIRLIQKTVSSNCP